VYLVEDDVQIGKLAIGVVSPTFLVKELGDKAVSEKKES
jgi:hypothetical protein